MRYLIAWLLGVPFGLIVLWYIVQATPRVVARHASRIVARLPLRRMWWRNEQVRTDNQWVRR